MSPHVCWAFVILRGLSVIILDIAWEQRATYLFTQVIICLGLFIVTEQIGMEKNISCVLARSTADFPVNLPSGDNSLFNRGVKGSRY